MKRPRRSRALCLGVFGAKVKKKETGFRRLERPQRRIAWAGLCGCAASPSFILTASRRRTFRWWRLSLTFPIALTSRLVSPAAKKVAVLVCFHMSDHWQEECSSNSPGSRGNESGSDWFSPAIRKPGHLLRFRIMIHSLCTKIHGLKIDTKLGAEIVPRNIALVEGVSIHA
jgi:hypothetical protein